MTSDERAEELCEIGQALDRALTSLAELEGELPSGGHRALKGHLLGAQAHLNLLVHWKGHKRAAGRLLRFPPRAAAIRG